MIEPPGRCQDCAQYGRRAPRTLGTEYAEFRGCRYARQRRFCGQATIHGANLYTHPDAGCQDFTQRTPHPLRTRAASPDPQKRD